MMIVCAIDRICKILFNSSLKIMIRERSRTFRRRPFGERSGDRQFGNEMLILYLEFEFGFNTVFVNDWSKLYLMVLLLIVGESGDKFSSS